MAFLKLARKFMFRVQHAQSSRANKCFWLGGGWRFTAESSSRLRSRNRSNVQPKSSKAHAIYISIQQRAEKHFPQIYLAFGSLKLSSAIYIRQLHVHGCILLQELATAKVSTHNVILKSKRLQPGARFLGKNCHALRELLLWDVEAIYAFLALFTMRKLQFSLLTFSLARMAIKTAQKDCKGLDCVSGD